MKPDHKRKVISVVAAIHRGPSTVTALAQECDVHKETVSRTLKALQEAGLVRFKGFDTLQTNSYGNRVRHGGQFPAVWEWLKT